MKILFKSRISPARQLVISTFDAAPLVARILLAPVRFAMAVSGELHQFRKIIRWTIKSRETTNFSYDLSDRNKQYLAWFVSVVTHSDKNQVLRYFSELENDSELRNHVRIITATAKSGWKSDCEPRFGRRLGWYAIVRINRPRVVVESGTDKGLGSIAIAAALRRNAEEGSPGHLYTVDINPRAGQLIRGPYSAWITFVNNDSVAALRHFAQAIDVFINDSDHSEEYEALEYETINRMLSPNGLVIGDNADSTERLAEFAEHSNRRFLFFREEPTEHWYPGGGIGVAYPIGSPPSPHPHCCLKGRPDENPIAP
jgi:predicted O-methyltransferase YrrM